MYEITKDTVAEEIIDSYVPQNIPLREKLVRKINEAYQWNFDAYNSAKKGDYSWIEKQLQFHLFHNC